jgi:DNA mismatch repair protein MutS2
MIGGAIAESILDNLHQKQAIGIVTTHYSNLKHYAEQTQGIINGAMLYDRGATKPLFQLSIGQAGSSFAVEIARQIGLPEDIIQQATQLVGEEHIDYDKQLQDIARDKRYWENKRKNIRLKEKQLEEKIANYEEKLSGIKVQKKQIIEEAKNQAAELLKQSNATIERTIREIKEAKAEKEKTKQARKKVEALKQTIDSQPQKQKSTTPANNNASKVLKDFSELKMLTKNPTKVIQQTPHHTYTTSNIAQQMRQKKLAFKRELDLRGCRVDEALELLISYVDDAVMVGADVVTILHGTGTGALKQLTRDYLTEKAHSMRKLNRGTLHFHDGDPNRGGAGITIIEIS